MSVEEAAILAAKVNRLAGLYANPNPATQVLDVIRQIPRAMEELTNETVKTARVLS